MNPLPTDDDGTDWDALLMREAERDPDLAEPQHLNGAIRWSILAVLALLVASCGCMLVSVM